MIKTTQYYRIADFIIAIQGEESIFTQLPNFAPFRVDETDETKMFIIRVSDESIPSNEHLQSVYTDRSDDDMPRIEIYENEQTTVFAVSQYPLHQRHARGHFIHQQTLFTLCDR